jgi:hypothetical protein
VLVFGLVSFSFENFDSAANRALELAGKILQAPNRLIARRAELADALDSGSSQASHASTLNTRKQRELSGTVFPENEPKGTFLHHFFTRGA